MPDNLYNPLVEDNTGATSSYLNDDKYSFWDRALPVMLKDAYNKSIMGMAQSMYTGKERFSLPNYHPGAGKDIAAHFLGMLMPLDMMTMLVPGGLAAKATGGLALQTQKGFAKSASNLLAKKGGMSKAQSYKALEDVVVRGSQNAAMFGTYEGLYDAAEAGKNAIIANGISLKHLEGKEDEVWPMVMKKGMKGLLKGATIGQLSGVARALRWTGGYGKVPGLKSFKGTKEGAFLNEMSAFGAFGPIMEGRVPGFQDFALAGATLGALKTVPVIKGGFKGFGSALRRAGLAKKSEPLYIEATDAQGNIIRKQASHILDEDTGTFRKVKKDETGTHYMEEDVPKLLSEGILEGVPAEIYATVLRSPIGKFAAKNISEKIKERAKKGKNIFVEDKGGKPVEGLEVSEKWKKSELRGTQISKKRVEDPNNPGKTMMDWDLENPITGRLWLGRNGASIKQFVTKDGKYTGEVIVEMSGEGGKVRYLLDKENTVKLFEHYTDSGSMSRIFNKANNKKTIGQIRTVALQTEIKNAINKPDLYGGGAVEAALANVDSFMQTDFGGKAGAVIEKWHKFSMKRQGSIRDIATSDAEMLSEFVGTLSVEEQFLLRRMIRGQKDKHTYFKALTEKEKKDMFYTENPSQFSGPVSSFLGAFRSGLYNLEDTGAQRYLRYIQLADGDTTVLQGERLAELAEILDFRFMHNNKKWNAYVRGAQHKGKRLHMLKDDLEKNLNEFLKDMKQTIANTRNRELKAFHEKRLETVTNLKGKEATRKAGKYSYMYRMHQEAKQAGVPVASFVEDYFPQRIRRDLIARIYAGDQEVSKLIAKELGESFATMTDTVPLSAQQKLAMNNIIKQYIDNVRAGLGDKSKRHLWTDKQKMDEHYLRMFTAIQKKLGPNASNLQVHLAIRYGSHNHTLKPFAALEKRRKPITEAAVADIDFMEIANEVDAQSLQELAGQALKSARESILETDALVVLTDYVSGASKRQVQVQHWGTRGQILDKLETLIDKDKRLKGAPKMFDWLGGEPLPNAPQTEFQAVNLMREVLTGDVNFTQVSTTSDLLRKVANLEMIAKINLGMATIPNVTQQFISTMISAGYWRFTKAMHKFATDPAFRAKVRKYTTLQSLQEEMVGAHDPTGAAIAGTQARAQTSMQRFVSLFSKGNHDKLGTLTQLTGDISGFNPMNRANQLMAGATAEILMQDLRNMALGKKGTGAFSFMDYLAPEFRKKYAKNKLQRLGLDVDAFLKGPGKGIKAEQKYNYEIARVMNKFARDSQLQRSFTKDPFLFNNPNYKPFLLFKRFGYRQAQYIYEQSKAEFLNGNIIPVLSIGLSGLAGMAFVQPAKAWITKVLSGEPEFSTRNKRAKLFKKGFGDVTFDNYLEAISAVGGFGMIGDLISDEDPLSSIEFMLKPVMFDDMQRIGRSFSAFLSKSETFYPSMKEPTLKALQIVSPAFGGMPSRLARRFETPKMEKDKATQRKRDAIQAAKDLIIAGKPSQASQVVTDFNRAWTGQYPSLRIQYEDFSPIQIMKDYANKIKKQKEEWEYKP